MRSWLTHAAAVVFWYVLVLVLLAFATGEGPNFIYRAF